MKERIILAPGANGNELIKSLALHGINTINLRICTAGELARLALMRSGVCIKEEFISRSEECTLIAKALDGIEYFKNPTYSDIKQITDAVRRMRSLATGDAEESQIREALYNGIFTDKNKALVSVYCNYMTLLNKNNQIDSVSLVKLAIEKCSTIDSEFITLEEFPLSPVETELITKLSNGTYKKLELKNLYNAEDKTVKIESIHNCYGAPNEVETILDDIYKGKPVDKCTVAVTDRIYGQLFFDYALLYNIPITFGAGIPIINTNPARLFVLYYRWTTGAFFSAAALFAMLESPYFDYKKLSELYPESDEEFSKRTFEEVLAGIRLTNNLETNRTRIENFKAALSEELSIANKSDERHIRKLNEKEKCIPVLEVIAEELALTPEEFIRKYSRIRRGSKTFAESLTEGIDTAAVSAIYDELSVIRRSGIRQEEDDLIKNVLSISICSQSSEPGMLHVTTIEKAASSIRENMYIAGLSATKYPGTPRENYLLLDDDLTQFGDAAEYLSSKGKIRRKQDNLLSLVKLSASLGSKIHLSYAGLNVSDLKRENASSMIFELCRLESGQTVTSEELEGKIIKSEYFEPAVSKSREIGKAYVAGSEITPEMGAGEIIEYPVPWNLDTPYSPSALSTFFGCPRCFMLSSSSILGIPEPEDDKPFETLSAKARGNLAHTLMEELANSAMSLEEFILLAGEYYDRFMDQNPALISDSVEDEKDLFLEMMQTAYETDPHREVVLAEEAVEAVHDSGVKLRGYPDRVERLDDGSCLIVDFKTGSNIGHLEDDIDTCLQVVIYAYMLEQKGYKVSGGEFRYIRLGETVSCKYDEEMKRALDEKMNIFRDAMLSGDFPLAQAPAEGEQDPCRYCKFGGICGKVTEGEELL